MMKGHTDIVQLGATEASKAFIAQEPHYAMISLSDPAAVRELLKRNTLNRPLNTQMVKKITQDILAGKWHVTGSGLSFADDGSLQDGQNRLSGILEALSKDDSFEVVMPVVWGLPVDARLVMDRGRKRSFADNLVFSGKFEQIFPRLPNTSPNRILAAKVSENFARRLNGWRRSIVSEDFVLEHVLEPYADKIEYIVRNAVKDATFRRAGFLTAMLEYFIRSTDGKMVRTFFKRVSHGVELQLETPEYLLREYLIASAADPKGTPAPLDYNYTTAAINKYHYDETVKSLRLPKKRTDLGLVDFLVGSLPIIHLPESQ